MSPHDPTVQYIRDCRSQGFTYQEIEAQMAKHGYAPDVIQRAIRVEQHPEEAIREGISSAAPPYSSSPYSTSPAELTVFGEDPKVTTVVAAIRLYIHRGYKEKQILDMLQQDGYDSTTIHQAMEVLARENPDQGGQPHIPLHAFPEMTPIRSAPSLFTVNGCGTTAYGHDQYDPATHTYVLTTFICICFLPIYATGAYRVADHPNGGWSFFGQVPVSQFWKNWNVVMMVLIPFLSMIMCMASGIR